MSRVSLCTYSVAVIVPTRNESGNVAPLVARLDEALGDVDAEIVFVDDSSDSTPFEIEAVAVMSPRRVRLLHRTPDERVGGLGGAVLAGLRSVQSDWVVVMDGDLQHPPEVVPDLVREAVRSGADLVVASRYVGSGTSSGLSTAIRRRVSGGANRLARMVFPLRLADCTDPMSGFFAVRRESIDLDRLRPRGFKILLETIARSPRLKLAEVPFVFDERHSGESKASVAEGVLFLRKLAGLRVASIFGRHSAAVARAVGFAAVGSTGIIVNSVALWAFVSVIGTNVLLGAALATQFSTSWNYVFTDWLIFTGPKRRSGWSRFIGFAVVNNVVLLLRLPVLSWLVHSAGVGYLMANLVTLIAAFVVRFLIADRYLFRPGVQMKQRSDTQPWGNPADVSPATAAESGTVVKSGRPVELVVDLRTRRSTTRGAEPETLLPFRYDVHGIVTIGSPVILKELESFRSQHLRGPLDIEIRAGVVGDGRWRRRTRVTQYPSAPAAAWYEEHLGRHGADFSVEMGDTIQVVVGPMLIRSPHVLYTNITEALLRFVMVSRGYMLLHAACLELEGRGVMMSALTDTGKTGTILRLLRENESKFLSDDMTILSPDGIALTYPKPLTISQHTLRAVNAGDLTKKEWRRLKLQSRLHSKEGRGVGSRLGEMNVPIMSLNAFTQYVVPPPKYDVDRLVPCERTRSVHVEDLFIIERNEHSLSELDASTLVDELIANTDDAYGFPPFRYFAPALVVDGMGYEELRAEERKILASALSGVRARRLATPDFSWADRIPALARDQAALDIRRSSAFFGESRRVLDHLPQSAAADHAD
jgi:dolichol-phosphate mannosyltransferase